MTLRQIAVIFLLGSSGMAQQPDLDVSDLLLPESQSAVRGVDQIVRRGLPGGPWWDDENQFFTRHGVSGEGHLMPQGLWSGDEEPLGLYTEEELEAVLQKIRGATGGDGVRFSRVGGRVLLETDYPEQAAAALGRVRGALPPPVTLGVTLERVDRDGAAVLLSGELGFRNGELRVLSDVGRRNLVFDFDVEIAQAAATANPIVGEATDGASIALRARPIPLGDEVVVEAVVRVGQPLPAETLQPHRSVGPFDRLGSRIDEAGLVFRVQRDQPARHEWTTLDGHRLRLTCKASWTPGSADVGGGAMLIKSPLFGAPVEGFRSTTAGEPEDIGGTRLSEIVERMLTAANSETMTWFEADGGPGGALWLAGERAQRVAQSLRSRVESALQGGGITVEVFDAPAGADVPASGAVPDGVRTVARFAGPLLVGHPVCFASARERTYVRDWDVEVAQASRIPDPKIGMVEDGWFATVLATRGAGGAPDRLEIALQVETLQELRSLSTSISSATVALTDASDSVLMHPDVIDIELPVTRSIRVGATVDLDEQGRAVLRRAATTSFGPGRVLIVRARVE